MGVISSSKKQSFGSGDSPQLWQGIIFFPFKSTHSMANPTDFAPRQNACKRTSVDEPGTGLPFKARSNGFFTKEKYRKRKKKPELSGHRNGRLLPPPHHSHLQSQKPERKKSQKLPQFFARTALTDDRLNFVTQHRFNDFKSRQCLFQLAGIKRRKRGTFGIHIHSRHSHQKTILIQPVQA